jgi:O-antigen ligase
VTAIAGDSTIAVLARRWRDPAAWLATVDAFAILTAASLPWSTSLPAIFTAVCWW